MSLATLMLQAPSRPRAAPRMAVVERVVLAGSMPPLHIRREEERYEVLEARSPSSSAARSSSPKPATSS